MNTSCKAFVLGIVTVLLFAAVYTNTGFEEADAAKAKKKNKIKDSDKAHKGLMAHKDQNAVIKAIKIGKK
ncbi:hypothetical protein [Candidatus Nitrosotenuis cloacae]|uniref:hypothetical protein n=1 Tax=Candidatus Nitrosotenuis cloacae TaxID=1603555 RepID=UPI00227F537E|nr:hypothetical protein [Candidatus Nitrosotenuis cloacae]